MERALFVAFPSITVVNLADVLDRIESVVDQVTLWCGFLRGSRSLRADDPGFEHCQHPLPPDAGGCGAEDAGATRMRIVRTFSVEFSVLGLLAGSVGWCLRIC